MQNNSKIIILCLALLIVVLGVLFYEVKKVPDVKWNAKYDYTDQEPQGLYVFKEVVTRYFEGVESKVQTEYKDTSATNGLYIYGGSMFSKASLDTVLRIANANNDVFLFSPSFPYDINDALEKRIYIKYQYADQVNFQFVQEEQMMDSTLRYKFINNELEYGDKKTYYLLSESSSEVYYSDNDYEYNDDYEVEEYEYDEAETTEEDYNTELLEGITSETVVIANDSLILMVKFKTKEGGNIYFHILPEMFFNHSYRQSQMFDYTAEILSHFDPKYITFVNKLPGRELPPTEHPLQFIMSSPPLKAAYYLLVLGMLMYAIFGSKRRQKAIPITDKNENTSLEYIETVSQLFYQQDKHEKLVLHMKNIFYHKMEQKYYLKKDHPEYLETLAKKSKVPKDDLQFILDRFRNHDDNYKFKAEQLISLNKRLEQVYTFINKTK